MAWGYSGGSSSYGGGSVLDGPVLSPRNVAGAINLDTDHFRRSQAIENQANAGMMTAAEADFLKGRDFYRSGMDIPFRDVVLYNVGIPSAFGYQLTQEMGREGWPGFWTGAKAAGNNIRGMFQGAKEAWTGPTATSGVAAAGDIPFKSSFPAAPTTIQPSLNFNNLGPSGFIAPQEWGGGM